MGYIAVLRHRGQQQEQVTQTEIKALPTMFRIMAKGGIDNFLEEMRK